MFYCNGTQYDVTPETLEGIHQQLVNWGPKFSDLIRITEHGAVVIPDAEVATIEVVTDPEIETIEPKESEGEAVTTQIELTELELEEIQVAVNLLDNKTIAQATPILEATAADESKSALWRQTYVEYASTEEKLPKGLRQIASDLYLASIS